MTKSLYMHLHGISFPPIVSLLKFVDLLKLWYRPVGRKEIHGSIVWRWQSRLSSIEKYEKRKRKQVYNYYLKDEEELRWNFIVVPLENVYEFMFFSILHTFFFQNHCFRFSSCLWKANGLSTYTHTNDTNSRRCKENLSSIKK